ncbi:hypothetical protein IC575_007316 [Cucumis melo]
MGERVNDEEHSVENHENEDMTVEDGEDSLEKMVEDRTGERKETRAVGNKEQEDEKLE